jgi:hypothetical protein
VQLAETKGYFPLYVKGKVALMSIILDEPDRRDEPSHDRGKWVCIGRCLTGQFYLDRREDSYVLLWTPWQRFTEKARQFVVSSGTKPLLDSLAAVEAMRKPRRKFTQYN